MRGRHVSLLWLLLLKVTWHSLLATVPANAPAIYLAHEFLDALPVHQFVKDPQRGWLEVMVDTAEAGEAAPHHLRFVLSPSES
jgi:NADH dehydrogenase [ubiquinone] 1 alpha subcomplex assembly factor 7